MKTFKRLVTAIAVAVCLFYVASLPENDWVFKKGNILGFNAHIVASGSMIPEFKPGDIILTYKENFSEIKKGDIITYLYDNKVIVHRVYERTPNYIKTWGDNNTSPDAIQITEKDYLGKVVFHTNF